MEHVIKELDLEMKEGPPIFYVNIIDDYFSPQIWEYIKEFFKTFKEQIGLLFIAKTTPNKVTEEKMKLLVDAGMT